MNLSGAPFSLGYAAKHCTLSLSLHEGITGTVITMLLIIGACSSVFYSLEFIRCVFFEPPKCTKSIIQYYRNDNLFSRYNNPTGNIGLLVLTSYTIYATVLGAYLCTILIDYPQALTIINPLGYKTNVIKAKELPIYGYSALSIPIVTCYAVAITTCSYALSNTKRELTGVQVISWFIPVIFFIHTFSTVHNISLQPTLIINLIGNSIPSNEHITKFSKILISYINEYSTYITFDIPLIVDFTKS
jgi:NADH:ubiquinone oxidoreductase subunit 5 (subunit L)/multisubunit Na+/H+ antiporter MnhA subunit